MKRLTAIVCLLVLCYPVVSHALVGVAFGGKLGYANYTGDILPSSGDVGNALMYGAVLEITTLPVLDFEFHANYFSKDFTYAYAVAGTPVSTEFEFRDFHILAMVKKNLVTVPASPFSLFVGAGLGWHLINTEVAKNAVNDPAAADTPFELFANNAKMSGHGLVGVKIAPPMFPLAIYGEARFGQIFTDDRLTTTQVEAGLMLKF